MQEVKVKTKNIFIRQPFTETSVSEQAVISGVIKVITDVTKADEEREFNILTGERAFHSNNFIQEWEKLTGLQFSPAAFRDYRIGLINKSDAFINIRTNMSESSAFEIAYNAYNKKSPMFFAVWDNAPIRTTLLQELEDLCEVTYVKFFSAEELNNHIKAFIEKL